MKEEKTKSKKKLIYYVILGVSVLLLAAATVLTVYFVTGGTQTVLDVPPADDQPVQDLPQGDPPAENLPSVNDPAQDDRPSGGGDTVVFGSPIDYDDYSVEYDVIYSSKTTGFIYRHKAIDFAAASATEVRAMADGVVERVSVSKQLGNLIVINHGNDLRTLYRFVEPVSALSVGATVKRGQPIGAVAEAYGSEALDGTHLHLEITLNDKNVDPTAYLEGVLDEK